MSFQDFHLHEMCDPEEYRGFTLRYFVCPYGCGNSPEVYVERHPKPNYGNRDASPAVTHLMFSEGQLPPRIDFKETPANLKQAKQLAHAWVDLTWNYINTGVSILEQISRAR